MKKGIIVKFGKEVKYYKANNDATLTDMPKIDGENKRTFKQPSGKVVVQNKLVEVTVYEDGKVDIKPHTQMEEYIA